MTASKLLNIVTRFLKVGLIIVLLYPDFSFGQIELQNAFPNLSFNDPLFLTNSGDGTNRVFVVEQDGIIKVFPNSSTAQTAKTFLNITDRVSSGGEMGLLGLAFHPNYETNGYFYVNYTAVNPLRTVISRFQVTANPDSANKNSEFQIMTFNQPNTNHNGGWLGFGPIDGYLYIASGDGGGSGDPNNNAQNITNLLGKILRINIANVPYSIPPTNPFYDSTGNVKKEIYAWGFRNPWRCSIDPLTNWFWAGDVGEGDWEEIDVVNNGKNYGWRCYEGNHSFNLNGCNYPVYTFPVWEYSHTEGFSITGGYVYRGNSIPALYGKYIYADYVTQKVWALTYDGVNTSNQFLLEAPGSVTSFGQDEFMELYLVSFDGNIYEFIDDVGCYDLNIAAGWNLVSVPFLNEDMAAANIFPNSSTPVYGYNGSYFVANTLVNGDGYWVKYNNSQTLQICGSRISFPVSVYNGWNLIGPFDNPIAIEDITTSPPNIIVSPYYGYQSGYIEVNILEPGKGYWVKTNTAGTIQLNSD
ncbi:MAG: PQQ-dependent sugar dehydrogenase [Ignavibacteriales bacterium]